MSTKDVFKEGLTMARGYSERLFAQFDGPSEWTHQVAPNVNHPLWVAGHLANTDNFALSLVAPDKAKDFAEYKAMFGGGSKPIPDASKYPDPIDVLATMQERRQVVLDVLEGLSDGDFDKSTPDGAPEFLPTVGSMFRVLIWHEGLHIGQATTAHRSLGKPPLMG